MENGPVVPYIVGLQIESSSNVSGNPADVASLDSEALSVTLQCGLRDVQNSDFITSIQELFGKSGCPTTYIDHTAIRTCLPDEFHRHEWVGQGPA
jgi:hypothetical protein